MSPSLTSDLRTCLRKQAPYQPDSLYSSNFDTSRSVGIKLQTELLALAAFDQIAVQDRHSELNRAIQDFLSTCSKLPNHHETKTPLAFFGGLGLYIYMSMEKAIQVKQFRNLPEVKERLSEILTLLGSSFESVDQLGNLLHDLRQVVFVFATNRFVDQSALLALIRRSWREFGRKSEDEQFARLVRAPDRNNFGEAEAAVLIDLFSVPSQFSSGEVGSHVDAIE